MSWAVVARKDFSDAVRSRSLWFLAAIFVLLSVVLVYAYAEVPEMFAGPGVSTTTVPALYALAGTMSLFVTLTAIVIGYKAVAGERESGSLKLLLALPHTRADVVAGKVLGRTGVLAVPVVLGLAVSGAVMLVLYESFAPAALAAFAVVTVAFALVYVGIVVGISAAASTTARASATAVGFFLVFELLWDVVPFGALYVANGMELVPPSQYPDWFYFLSMLPPSSAYVNGLGVVLPDVAGVAGERIPASVQDAFYLQDWFGYVVLLVWLAVPLAVGYWRFDDADL